MTDRELLELAVKAMQQALEALENERKRSDGWVSVGEHKAVTVLQNALNEIK